MDLWIRSQDNDLSMIEDIVQPTCYDSKNWHLSAYTSKGRFITLGIYQTEQRALEVLDEIQEILEPKYTTEYVEKEKALDCGLIAKELVPIKLVDYSRTFQTYVYEMPKE